MHKLIVPQINCSLASHGTYSINGKETMVDLPIAGITRAACIRIIAEQHASTLATSAVEIALAVQ